MAEYYPNYDSLTSSTIQCLCLMLKDASRHYQLSQDAAATAQIGPA